MKTSLRRNILLIMILAGAWFVSSPLFAAGAPGVVGTIDGRILLMLHPLMANFDYTNGRFYRSDMPNKDFNQVLAELQKAQAEANKRLEGLQAKEENLSRSRQELVLKRAEVINDLLEKAASASYIMRDKEKKVGEFEARYAAQLAALDAQLKQVKREIFETREAAMSSIYLTTRETEQRLAEIRKELQTLIAQAATEYGIGVVIDNTYAMSEQRRAPELPQVPAIEESADVVSASLYHSFANLVIDQQGAETLKMPPGAGSAEDHMMVGRSIGLSANLKQYLEFRNYLPEKVAAFSPGQMFLFGGTDLTPWVARKIFDRYKIPEALRNSFMILIRNYSEFEKANY